MMRIFVGCLMLISLKIPSFPTKAAEHLTLQKWTTLSVKWNFRKAEISVLVEALDIPETFTCNQGSVIDGIEGLCF